MKTLKTAINSAVNQLAHLERPLLEAELLAAYVLESDRSFINAHPETELTQAQEKRFSTLVKRAARLEPLAYLTGKKDFYNHSFLVNKHVLIPRPETEELVELAMQKIEQNQANRVLDIGTGSGAIALSLAAESNQPVIIDAIDPSLNAVKVAEMNKIRISPKHSDTRVNLITSSLEQYSVAGHYDLIVSNPPYIPTDEVNQLDETVRSFEPHLALDGGKDGLKIYRQIARRLVDLLTPEGVCLCEIHSPLAIETADVFVSNCPGCSVTIHKDLQGRMRIIEVTLSQQ